MALTWAIPTRKLSSALLFSAIFFVVAASGAFKNVSDDICSGLFAQPFSDADDYSSKVLEYFPDYAFDLWCPTYEWHEDEDDGTPLYNLVWPSKITLPHRAQGIFPASTLPQRELALPHSSEGLLLGLGAIVASFTLLPEIQAAVEQAEYAVVQTQLRNEWLKVGGVLMGLLTLESAIFALTPDSLLAPTNTVARLVIAVASIATAAGILCDTYLLLRFSRASIQAFKRRAEDGYRVRGENGLPASGTPVRTYVVFAVLARLPLFLALLAMMCITALLGAAAYELSPLAVLGVFSVVGGVLALRYLFWAFVWTVFAVSKMSTIVSGLCTRVMRSARALLG